MLNVTEAAATVNFDQSLLRAVARAKEAYPAERCRIERGLAIVLAGGVTLSDDGTAKVSSQSHQGAYYKVNGHCTCVDASTAPQGRCKHRWSKSLYKWALANTPAAEPVPPQRYYATYTTPWGEDRQGVAEWHAERGSWLFVPEDGAEPAWVAASALVLGGNCAIADAKRAEEEAQGGLVAIVTGYGRQGAL